MTLRAISGILISSIFSKKFLGMIGILSGKYSPRSGAKPFITASANEQYFELWLRL
jgi:hypothetical protein